jgi:hypothetical protein
MEVVNSLEIAAGMQKILCDQGASPLWLANLKA